MTPDELLAIYQHKRKHAEYVRTIGTNEAEIEVWMITPDIARDLEKDSLATLLQSFHRKALASDPQLVQINFKPDVRQHRGQPTRVLVISAIVRIGSAAHVQ